MYKMSLAAAAAFFSMTSTGLAQEHAPPAGALPPAVISQINLGKAGLLNAYYSDVHFGLVQARFGLARGRIGGVQAGGPSTGFKEETHDVLLAYGARKLLPDGKSYLLFGGAYTNVNDAPNLTQAEGDFPAYRIGYQNFFSPDAMFSASVTYIDFGLDSVGIGTTTRPTTEFRLDYVSKLTDHWGFAGRALFARGTSKVVIDAPGLVHEQNDDRYYLQADLVGQYRSDDISIVPKGWVLHPALGVSYMRSVVEETANNFGIVSSGVLGPVENYGSVWATAELEKEVPLGSWAPKFKLGIEHEYLNDLNAFLDEDTYVIAGIGASTQTKNGQRLEFGYERRQGINGNRVNNILLMALGLSF